MGKAILNLEHQISDCIKELFMLTTALCTACFSRAKINKKLWLPYFKIRPSYFECSGAGTGSGSLLLNRIGLRNEMVRKKMNVVTLHNKLREFRLKYAKERRKLCRQDGTTITWGKKKDLN